MDQKYGEFVGVDSLYYAPIAEDSAAAYTAGTPLYLAPAAEIAGAPKVNRKTTYYDNKPANTFTTEGETEIKVVVSNVPARLAGYLLGKPYDAASGRVFDTGKASPPEVALGFRYDMGTDGFRYYWYLKGTFSGGSEDAKSMESDVDVKTYELTFTAITTTHEWTVGGKSQSMKRVYGDTADGAFDPSGWFGQVQTPDTAAAPAALALSSIAPAAGASDVSRSAAIVLTFSNALADEEITVVTAAGALVACAKAFDASGKVLTLTPSSQLAASALHIVSVAGVVDVYGQKLAAVTRTFTTAA